MQRLTYWLGLVVTAGAMVGGMSCSSNEPGVSVRVTLGAAEGWSTSHESEALTTNLGFEIELRHAYLSTASTEIFACTPIASRWTWAWLRSAHAHAEGSPTLLGTSAVESLLDNAPARLVLGELSPPPASYCRVKRTFGPADADARGLPTDAAMVGRTLFMDGKYSRPGTAAERFVFSSSDTFTVELPFETTALSSDGRFRLILVLGKTNAHWFDDVDFETRNEPGTVRQLIDNVTQSLRARAE